MAIDTSPNVASCGKLDISEMEGVAHETPRKADGWRDRPAWVGAYSSEPEQEPAMQSAGRDGAVYRTVAGDSLPPRLVPCESDSVNCALLTIRKAVRDQPLAETGSI
jgi:hypothetical protein